MKIVLLLFVVGLSYGWKPTQCGNFANLITQWGKQVDPNNVLPEYPRPQMVRGDKSWHNLNGIWQFQPGSQGENPPFNKTLQGEILVPFPVESCLSGIGKNYEYLWVFSLPSTLLHFGAVDWSCSVYVNEVNVGNHTGGYSGFTFDITNVIRPTSNELIVFVYDPSDKGAQPNGKQRISAINDPGGDTYTPSSGIWQTVWLENVPHQHIKNLTLLADTRSLQVTANVESASPDTTVTFQVEDNNKVVATATAKAGEQVEILIPDAKIWDPNSPFLYNLSVSISGDSVLSYFGMRSITNEKVKHPGIPDTGAQIGIDRPGMDMPGYPVVLPSADYHLCWKMCNETNGCKAWAYADPKQGCDYKQPMCWLKSGIPATTSNGCRVSGAVAVPPFVARRPFLNGGFLYMAGWLDQSWWPDGQYTAPTDEALLFDLQQVKKFGLNTVRLHQKVNPERWYWYADKLGIIVLQDAVQKYGGATKETIPHFLNDLNRMIDERYNHPCIIQWDVFNEEDCVGVFNATAVVEMVQNRDPSRLVDTNSGGPANDLHIADVNDWHTYPYPGHPMPSATQYAMLGEFGGVGAFVAGHEWVPNKCTTYLQVKTPEDEANTYIDMVKTIKGWKEDLSVTIYTQITDVERECDGFLNYDRTNKFTEEQTNRIAAANQDLIYSASDAMHH